MARKSNAIKTFYVTRAHLLAYLLTYLYPSIIANCECLHCSEFIKMTEPLITYNDHNLIDGTLSCKLPRCHSVCVCGKTHVLTKNIPASGYSGSDNSLPGRRQIMS